MTSDAVHYLSLIEVSKRLRRGELKPTTLSETILARIAQHDGALRSYTTLLADLRPGGIKSWSILPFGNSTDPKNPHYTDQMEMFGRGEYKETFQKPVSTVTLSR